MATNPDHSTYLTLGNDLKDKGQLKEAIAAYRQAIALYPAYAEAYSNLGVALVATGKLEEAIAAYRTALSLSPSSSEIYFNLGKALHAAGKGGRGDRRFWKCNRPPLRLPFSPSEPWKCFCRRSSASTTRLPPIGRRSFISRILRTLI
jgi:tetratricopeptide (TPR) repeat protein